MKFPSYAKDLGPSAWTAFWVKEHLPTIQNVELPTRDEGALD